MTYIVSGGHKTLTHSFLLVSCLWELAPNGHAE